MGVGLRLGRQDSSGETHIFLKLSPAEGTHWRVWNTHIIAEAMNAPGVPLRFVGFKDFDTANERGNVASWPIEGEPQGLATGFKVALRPFDGCDQKQPIKGVVLKPEMPLITR